MTLLCAVCLYVRKRARPADTVIEGYAVCDDHLGYVVQGEQFASILRAARREDTDPDAAEPGLETS